MYTAMASFLGEGLFPYNFDMEHQQFNIKEFANIVGDEIFSILYPCALEFYFSNEYPHPSTGNVWNVIDFFLKKQETTLSNKERAYYTGFRDSYMDLYEVIHITLNQSITLRSLLKYDAKEIVVKEKKGTQQLSQWDIIGGRIITTPEGNFLSGGVLALSRKAADNAKESIELITDKMLTRDWVQQAKAFTTNPELMVKKMWAKEIAHYWFQEVMVKPESPDLFNTDGDKLQFCSIEYSLADGRAFKKAIIKKLNNLPELYIYDAEDVTHAWIWPAKKKNLSLRKGKNTDKGLELETLIQDPKTGEQCPIYAEIKIKDNKLIIDVNSTQRANIVEEYFNSHLVSLVDKPVIINHDLKDLPEMESQDSTPKLHLPKEQEIILMNQYYSQHYKEWSDYPIPALDNQTPREAVKNKQSRKKVITLLKQLQNMEQKTMKATGRKFAYDFGWLFEELGINKNEL